MKDKSKKRREGGWLTRWRAPKQQARQLATLQEGFNELVGLTRSIREHMDQQSQTQRTLTELLTHVPDAVAGLKQVGQATQQQTETLDLLKKQLEASARNEGHMVESMQKFNQTLQVMDNLSKSTSQTVTTMADRTRDSEEMLRAVLERSERRLVYMIVGLMVLTVTVLGVGLYVGLSPRDPAPTPPAMPTIEEADTPFQPTDQSIVDLVVDEDEEEPDEPAPLPEEVPAEDMPEDETEPEDGVIDDEHVAEPAEAELDDEVVPETDETEEVLEDVPEPSPVEEDAETAPLNDETPPLEPTEPEVTDGDADADALDEEDTVDPATEDVDVEPAADETTDNT